MERNKVSVLVFDYIFESADFLRSELNKRGCETRVVFTSIDDVSQNWIKMNQEGKSPRLFIAGISLYEDRDRLLSYKKQEKIGFESSIEIIKSFRENHPDVPIIAWASSVLWKGKDWEQEAMKAGASICIEKGSFKVIHEAISLLRT